MATIPVKLSHDPLLDPVKVPEVCCTNCSIDIGDLERQRLVHAKDTHIILDDTGERFSNFSRLGQPVKLQHHHGIVQ